MGLIASRIFSAGEESGYESAPESSSSQQSEEQQRLNIVEDENLRFPASFLEDEAEIDQILSEAVMPGVLHSAEESVVPGSAIDPGTPGQFFYTDPSYVPSNQALV